MVHHYDESKGLEVDHFDPRKKKLLIQEYSNLMPATPRCNGRKSNIWPSPGEAAQGIRLIDPTKEKDYGTQIFEDPATNRLVGTTPAAKYHIRVLGLNDEFFVRKRRDRTQMNLMMSIPYLMQGHPTVNKVQEQIERMIPAIPPPPIAPPQGK
tara:strand:+ start:3641 stop:4099 length:459 start_codon:yes stop_codon:yes gene_type:complete